MISFTHFVLPFFLLHGRRFYCLFATDTSADPTADVEGHDVQAKIALLTKLAFGATVSSASVRLKQMMPDGNELLGSAYGDGEG